MTVSRGIALVLFLAVASTSFATTTMDVIFNPAQITVNVGDEFVVSVFVRSTDHQQIFDNVRLLMDYDYTKLSVEGTTDPLAEITYVYGIPMYHWVSPVKLTADQELPGIRFKALATVTAMPINLSGPVVDELGNSYQAVKDNCTTDLQGTLYGTEVTIAAPVPEPLTLVATFMGVAGLGAYVRRRTRAMISK